MALENVESVAALTPLQRLMLVNIVSAGGTGAHVDQVHLRLEGALDPVHLRAAWNTVVTRHAALRTAFFWEGLSAPMQVVRAQVDLPWAEADCRDLPEAERSALVERRAREEQAAAFDLARAPVMRFVLLRTGTDTYEFVWTYVVLLLDGWSIATIVREVFALHEALRAGTAPALPPARPFRDYVQWLAAQDESLAEQFWRRTLGGLQAPTPIPVPGGALPAVVGESAASVECEFTPPEVDRVRSAAQTAHVTMGTVVQGAWAIVLAAGAGTGDVVFGVGSSGRPADLDAVERIVGQFTANIPARVAVTRDASAPVWLQSVQRTQLDAREYEHAPLDRIEQWSGLAGRRLFESIVQVHNFPLDGTFWEARGFVVSGLRKVVHTNYPLALVAIPKPGLTLRIVYDGTLWPESDASALLEAARATILALASVPAKTVGEIADAVSLPSTLKPGSRTLATKRAERPASEAPMTPLQSRIAAIWRDVLGLDTVGTDDNLFELGGRSVHAVRIHERIQAENLGKLSVVELFQYPTVGLLAARLEGNGSPGAETLTDAEARGRQRADAARDRRDRLRQSRPHE